MKFESEQFKKEQAFFRISDTGLFFDEEVMEEEIESSSLENELEADSE
ncbi:hypothetical protein [Agarivorans sp. B2Z047]|nr:hypothetical protein [Agarivorans sp. B2Z047]UQN41935.1 hypothetical protein LQZ07_19480 [Agarivorans sp. B2Z047]